MGSICVAPFDEFWRLITDPEARDSILWRYGDSTADTPENRRKAYNALLATFRARGELCEHPSHQHEPTKQ